MLSDHAFQVNPRVAFQGEPGAFGDLAIQRAWPAGAIAVPCGTFDAVLDALVAGAVDLAVVPVENLIVGPVAAALEALEGRASLLEYASDLRLPVHHALMAPRGATLEGLRTVRSHPVALAQCQRFLTAHAWIAPVEHFDTAGAARDVAGDGDVTVGAIASEAAAERYGLVVLAHGVQDAADNWTRFVVLRRAGVRTA
ncbi:MAG: hypothetical protein IT356_09825 [Gemmatimonadaceae bacterium]|nr:hypothetical protein [Gemmatimonadaceae bacterium]